MQLRRRRFLRLTGTAVAALFASPLAWAQDYPTRGVTIVVPFTPGGSTDIIARMLAQKLEQRLGKSFVVENRPGAGTIIAASAVAKSAPDGYLLLMAPSSTMAINVTLYKKLPYDPATDFIPLAGLARVPFVLIVNPSLPVHSLLELIAYAKERPGQLSFASVGPGVPHHLYAELHRRHRDDARPLQRQRTRLERCRCRTHSADVLRYSAGHWDVTGRQGSSPRRHHQDSRPGASEHSADSPGRST
jgi:tripartite-type tricarboxylate transporter receptor subunit TctC